MKKNPKVWALTGDLGYGGFDKIQKDFPDRFLNCGAAEQSMLDIAVGLAYEGCIPITYTITPFYYRAFETIRTYIAHEQLPIIMVGAGRDRDYSDDGISHWADDAKKIFDTLKIIQVYPGTKEDVDVESMIRAKKPIFLSLARR